MAYEHSIKNQFDTVQSDNKFFSKWVADMLESLKKRVLDHRASVSVSADLCNLEENHAILRLTGYLGDSAQKLVIGLPQWGRRVQTLLLPKYHISPQRQHLRSLFRLHR